MEVGRETSNPIQSKASRTPWRWRCRPSRPPASPTTTATSASSSTTATPASHHHAVVALVKSSSCTADQAQQRLQIFGPNKLEEKEESKFLGFMSNPLSWAMEGGSCWIGRTQTCLPG